MGCIYRKRDERRAPNYKVRQAAKGTPHLLYLIGANVRSHWLVPTVLSLRCTVTNSEYDKPFRDIALIHYNCGLPMSALVDAVEKRGSLLPFPR